MNKGLFEASPDNKQLLLVLLAVALFLSTSLFVQARSIMLYSETSDFSAYFAAYSVKRDLGSGIYDREVFAQLPAAESVKGGVREYLYTPLFAEALSVFMPSDYTPARLVWLVLEHASIFMLFLITGLILMRTSSAARVPAFMLSALVVFSFSAIERSFHYGQASAVVALLLYLAVFLHYAGRAYLATFFAAFATVLKIYPIVYLIALVIKGHFKEAGVMVLWIVAIVVVSVLLFGGADWAQFVGFQADNPLVDRSGGSGGASALSYEVPNYSPTAMFYLLSDQFGWGWSQGQVWEVMRIIVLLAGAAIYAIYWRRIYESFGFLQTVGLGLIGIMLVSPLLWNHVFIMLLPIYAVLLYRAAFDPEANLSSFVALTLSFALVAFPDFMTNLAFTNNGALVLLKYTKLYGLLILAFYLCFSSYAWDWKFRRAEGYPNQ